MSEKTKETTEVQLKPETLAISEQIQKIMALDATANGEMDASVFNANLPDGITVKQVEALFNYLPTYGAAQSHAYGLKAVPVMAANKDIQEATFVTKLPGRNNNISIDIRREKKSFNPQDRDNPIVAYGHMDYSLNLSAGNAKSGEIGRARRIVKELAQQSFSV